MVNCNPFKNDYYGLQYLIISKKLGANAVR